jgi:membrane associated rhomboid family serine protease
MFFPIKDYNPTEKTAYVTIVLIIINVAVFSYQAFLSPKPLQYHIVSSAMVPAEITHFKNVPVLVGKNRYGQNVYYRGREISPFLSILTSLFMHASIWHLLGNMLFLWIFGNNIEDFLGKFKFIIFYFLCGGGAALVHVLFHFNSQIPVIGASGAVSGVMGAYLILYPHARVRTLVFIFIIITFMDIPAYIFLVVWFAFQFLYAGSGSGIAWIAHVGGFVIGVLLIKQLRKKHRRPIIEIIE